MNPADSNPSGQRSAGAAHWLPLKWRRVLSLPFDRSMRRARRTFRKFPEVPFQSLVDVGAHRGEFTDLARLYYDLKDVWMVEADPELAAQLRTKYEGAPDCRVVHAAVAREAGELEFRILKHRASSSLLPVIQRPGPGLGVDLGEARRVKVPALPLDTLFQREGIGAVDLMKVDIQGAERMLIQGGTQALRKVRWLFIEVFFDEFYEGSARFGEIDNLLWALGFRLHEFASFRRAREGHIAYGDAVYRNITPAA